MKLDLSNKDFCLFLMTEFPFGSNEEKETMLSDYIVENFQMPSESWFEELAGKTDESGQEVQPWNGYTWMYPINDNVTFYAEFHPNETIYFFNDTYLGNTGGHFHLSLLRWAELKSIVAKQDKDPSLLFFMLLPLTLGDISEQEDIRYEIALHLTKTSIKAEDLIMDDIANFLTSHVVAYQGFEYREGVGFVTQRNHSERNHMHSEEDLRTINDIIGLAVK
ncbi:Imm19 family immunity protein [Sphingobacterium spiritivorum]|nr:Imm19 family immunity protein [Sphingobacterium spiritivorum]